MIAINVEAVCAVVYAQSALYYHVSPSSSRPAVLCRDQSKALEECVKNCFVTLALNLSPYLDDINTGEEGQMGCEVKAEFLGVGEKRIRYALEAALAYYTIHLVALGEDEHLSDNYLTHYLRAMEHLERMFGASDSFDVRLKASHA